MLHGLKGNPKKISWILIVLAAALFSSPAYALTCDSGTKSGTCTVTTNQSINAGTTESVSGDLVIDSGGIIFNQTNNESFALDVAGNFTMKSGSKIRGNVNVSAEYIDIQQNSMINASRLGYTGGISGGQNGNGPGAGSGSSAVAAGGAGYGAEGGEGSSDSQTGGTGGSIYGSTENPASFGSGGGAGDFTEKDGDPGGGDGGGRIILNASKNATVNGTVLANGEAGSKGYNDVVSGGSNPGGGGSGGTILINGGFAKGKGTVTALGGDGGIYEEFEGGGGSGGRVSFSVNTFQYTGDLSVLGGVSRNTGGTGTLFPFAILCDEGTVDTQCIVLDTAQLSEAEGSGELVVQDTGEINSEGELKLNFSEIQVNSGGKIKSGTGMNFSGTDFMNISGSINTSGRITLPSNSKALLNNSKIISGGLDGSDVNLSAYNYSIDIKPETGINNDVNFTKILSPYAKANSEQWITSGYMNFSRRADIDIGSNNVTFPDGFLLKGEELYFQAKNILVEPGGKITGTGMGYEGGLAENPGNGPGATDAAGSDTGGAGGAAFAGSGGAGNNGLAGGTPYGRLESNLLGSGGGGGAFEAKGGNGGGIIDLEATSTLTLNGTINSEGGSGATDGINDAGAGSGGNVLLRAQNLSGRGLVSVRGGDGTSNSGGGGAGRVQLYFQNNKTDRNTSDADGEKFSVDVSGGGGANSGETGTIMTCKNYGSSRCPGVRNGVNLQTNTDKSFNGMYLARELQVNITDSFIKWRDDETRKNDLDSSQTGSVNSTYTAFNLKPNYLIKAEKNDSTVVEKNTNSTGGFSFTTTIDGISEFTIAEGYNPEVNPGGRSISTQSSLIPRHETNFLNFSARDNQSGIDKVYLKTDQDGSMKPIDWYTKDLSTPTDLQNLSFTWQNGSSFQGVPLQTINWKATVEDLRGNNRTSATGSFQIDGDDPMIQNPSPGPTFDVDIDNPYTTIEYDINDTSGLTTWNGFNSVDDIVLVDNTNTSGNYSMTKKPLSSDTFGDCPNIYEDKSECNDKFRWEYSLSHNSIEAVPIEIYATDTAGNVEKLTRNVDFQNITVTHDSLNVTSINSTDPIQLNGDSLLLPNNEDPNGNHDLDDEDNGYANVYVSVDQGFGYNPTQDSGFRLNRYNTETYQTCSSGGLFGGGGCTDNPEDDGLFRTQFTATLAGTHQVKTIVQDNDGVSGVQISNFNTSLDVQKPQANFRTTPKEYLDVDSNNHTLNISTDLTRSTDAPVDKVVANVSRTDSGFSSYYLNNNSPKTQAQRWNKLINTTEEFNDALGEYNITYSANTTRGIGSDRERTDFFLQNITTTLNKDKSFMSPGAEIEIDGVATLRPNNTFVNGSVNGTRTEIYFDDAYSGNTSIGPNGSFNKTVIAPTRGGIYDLRVLPINHNNISGITSQEISVALEMKGENARSVETGNSFVDANTDVNTSVKVTESSVNYPENNVSHVIANVSLPNGSQVKYPLVGDERGGTYSGVMNTTDLLGNYTVTYHANLTNGFSDQFESKTSFKVQNITTTQNFNPRVPYSEEPTEISGTATLRPENVGASGNYEIYRDRGFGQNLISSGTLNASGGYSHTFNTEVAGTHLINTSVTNPDGIHGFNTKKFNTTLDIRNPEAIYDQTGTEYLDIDDEDHGFNLSASVTNSTDSDVSRVTAYIERPFETSSTSYSLDNTTFTNRSQTWFTTLDTGANFGDRLGEYDIELEAETERGIGSNIPAENFFLQNISISQSLDSSVIDWDESTTMSGTVLLKPNDTGIDPTLNIFLDREQLNTATPDSQGGYSYFLTAPDTAGVHNVKINTSNGNSIDGENQLDFKVKIAMQNEQAYGLETGNSYINPNEDINLSVKVPKFNVPNSTSLSAVQASIENSSGFVVATESLSGNSSGGTWNQIYTNTPPLGDYTVSYDATFANGYTTQQTSETSFKVRNVTTTQVLDKKYVNSSEPISVTGDSLLRPVDNPVSTKVQLFRNTRGSWEHVKNSSLNVLGEYDTSFSTAVAGTHQIRVNVTDENGIRGFNQTDFNVSLNISEEKSVFQETDTRYLDVDLADHELNVSAFVSNSTDSDVDQVNANITSPGSSFEDITLTNTEPRDSSGYWYQVINTTKKFGDELGEYSIDYRANTTRGIGSNFPSSDFVLDNITLTQRLDKPQIDATTEDLVFNGTATYQSDGTPVTGETARVYLDGVEEGTQYTTDGTGFYSFKFTPTAEAGRHNITVKINDTNNLAGKNTSVFEVLINLQNPSASSRSTGNEHANLGDTVDLSVDIPSFTIADEKSLKYVKAEIDRPQSAAENISLSGPAGGGTYSGSYSKTDELGDYNVTFYSELENGFNSQVNSETSFSVENLSVEENLDSETVTSNESMTVSGDVTILPFGTPANGTAKIYRNTTGSFELIDTVSIEDGSYSSDIQTVVAGTHELVVNSTNTDGINGTNSTRFNTTLDISDTDTIFEGTGTNTLDVKNQNANLNISGFISNSTDSDNDKAWVLIDLPGGATDRIFLNNLESKDQSGTWNKIINVSSRYGKQSGAYTATFYANTTRGIGSNNPSENFYVQSIKISENLNKQVFNPRDSLTVQGTAKLVSNDDPVTNEGVTVSVDNSPLQPDPVTTTDGEGDYQHTFSSPETAGTHTLEVNTTNDEDVSGFNSTEFETRINLTEGVAKGIKTDNSHVNLEENVSVNVRIPESNVDSSRQISTVNAELTRPNGTVKTLELDGASSGGVWTGNFNNTTNLGVYNISFNANLSTGFTKQIDEGTDFSVENVTVTENIEDRTVNSTEPMNVSGYATLRPNSTDAPGSYKITRYIEGDPLETVASGNLNSSGGYSETIRTAIAGTHSLEVNITTPSGINGSIEKKFNTTLNVSEPEARFQRTETDIVDVDSNNSMVNLSAFVSNSSTGFVYETLATIEAPNGSRDTKTLDPETSNLISNTWKTTYNTTENFGELQGEFKVTYESETDRGIGSNFATTKFYVKNISITEELNDSEINPNESIEVSGKVLETPSMDAVADEEIKIIADGEELATTTSNGDGTFVKSFRGPDNAGNFDLTVRTVTAENVSGFNSTSLDVFNISSRSETNTTDVFRDTDSDSDLEFNDNITAHPDNPGDVSGVSFTYDTPTGFDGLVTNSLLNSISPGEIKDNDPVYDIQPETPLGPQNITATGLGDSDIRTSSDSQVTVWSKSDADLDSPPSIVSRSGEYHLINATVIDITTGDPLSNISTNFTVDGKDSTVVETNGTGVATFNWTIGDYSPGEHTVSVRSVDEPGKYINSTDLADSTTVDISGKIRLTDYSVLNEPVYRKNGSSPESTVFNIRLVDSEGIAIQGANVSFGINGTELYDQTDENGYVSKSYNPRDSIEANNYTVNITARKENYSTVNRNESIIVGGILNTTHNTSREIYRRGVSHDLNLTVQNEYGETVEANTKWLLNDTNVTDQVSDGLWTPSVVTDLGTRKLTSNTTREFFRTDVDGREVEIYGNAEISALDPPSTDLLPNISYNITARIQDANISTGVSNLPVNISINNTDVFDDNSTNQTEGFNTTEILSDSSGYAKFNWTPENGNYTISSSISNNESLNYNATVEYMQSDVTVARNMYITNLSVSEDEIFRNDSKTPHKANFTVEVEETDTDSTHKTAENTSVRFEVGGTDLLSCETDQNGVCEVRYNASEQVPSGNVTIEAFTIRNGWNNALETDGVLIKDSLRARVVKPDTQILNRGKTSLLNASAVSDGEEVDVGIDWDFRGQDIGTDEKLTQWDIPETEPRGNGSLQLTASGDTYGTDIATVRRTIYGLSNINFTSQTEEDRFEVSESPQVRCNVYNNLGSAISSYPVSFQSNGSEFAESDTAETGVATAEYNVPNKLSTFNLSCSITDNQSLLYNDSVSMDRKTFTTFDETKPEVRNLTLQPGEIQPGDSFNVTFNAFDSVGIDEVSVSVKNTRGERDSLEVDNRSGQYYANYTTPSGASGTYEVQATVEDTSNNTGFSLATITADPGGEINLDPSEYTVENMTNYESESFRTDVAFVPDNTINYTNITTSTPSNSSPVSFNSSRFDCGNISSGEGCTTSYNLTIEKGTSPGTVYGIFTAEWMNLNQSERNTIKKILPVDVAVNPILREEYGNWNPNIAHGSSVELKSVKGETSYTGFILNSTGNEPVKTYKAEFEENLALEENERLRETWVQLEQDAQSTIDPGQVHTTSINITVPGGTAKGTYNGSMVFRSDNTGTLKRNISVNIPQDPDFEVLDKELTTYAVINQSYSLEDISIENIGNVNLTAETEVSGNASEKLSAEPTDLPIQETTPVGLQYKNFTNNRTHWANITFRSQEDFSINNEIKQITGEADVAVKPVKFNLSLENRSKRSDAETGDILTAEFDVKVRGENQTDNLSFNPVVNETSADIISKNGSNGSFTVDFEMPDLSDGKLYDFQMMVNETSLNVTTWDQIDNKYYIPDITKPEILKLDAEDKTVGEDVTINATVTDNHYKGVSNVTFDITKPSGNITEVNSSLVEGYWIHTLDSEDLEGKGDYDVEVVATDPAGNKKNISTMFRYSENTEFSGSFTDAAGNAQSANFTFKDSDSDKELQKISVNSNNGDYSTSLLEGNYDITVEYSDNVIELDNAEVNDTVSNAVRLDEVSPSVAPYADPDHTPESVMMSLAGETNLSIEQSSITLDYENYEDNIPTGADLEEMVVSRCGDYDYEDISCDGEYELYNLTNSSVDRAENTVTLTTSGFSIYTAFFPGSDFMEEEPTPQTEEEGSGSGGGGGSQPATQQNVSDIGDQLSDLENPLEIQDQRIDVSLQPNESTTRYVRVLNNLEEPTTFTASVTENIRQFVDVEESIEVENNSLTEIRLNLSVNGTPEHEIYRGGIEIAGTGSSKNIPVVLRIEEEETYVAGDSVGININPEQNTVNPGNNLSFRLQVTPSRSLLGTNITLDYFLRKPGSSGQVLAYKNNVETFEGLFTGDGEISIPNSTESGEYVLEVRAAYGFDGEVETSSSIQSINVREPLLDRKFLGITYQIYLIVFMLLLIGGGGGYEGYMYYQSYLESQKRYKQEIDKSSLPGPKEDGGSGYLGTLADRDDDAYLGLDELTTHGMVAGATGSGKSVTGQAIVEEALEQGVNVIVLDPTAQWSGYLRKCTSDDMLKHYSEFDMSANDARAYDGNIRAINSPDDDIDIQYLLQNDEQSGSIVTFSLHKLESKDIESFASSIIQQVFEANCSEREHLDTLIVFDEAHRLLKKFGGSGDGLNQLERGAREFRKWGIGMLLLSQVISDFPSEIRTNVGTKIQMRTRNQSDLDHYKDNYGMDTVRSIVKANVGSGMIQNSDYNGGNPYFVNFRPLKHSVHRLSDEELDKYEEYNRSIDEVEEKIQKLEDQGQEVYEYRSNLKLCRKNLRKGSFNLVDIYLDELKDQLQNA